MADTTDLKSVALKSVPVRVRPGVFCMIKITKKLLPKNFILALSGGVDSLAVAHFFKQSKKDFLAVHINAKYIPEDDEYENVVRNFCTKFDIPLLVKTVTEKACRKSSPEAFCREQRYKLLLESCIETNIKNVVVCHHMDDCVESYLINCLNGKPEYTPIPFVTKYPNASISRPFILTQKSDFWNYIKSKKLQQYVAEDKMNTDLTLKRNWVRHVLRPTIETQYKGIVKVVKKRVQEKLKQHIC
jgi:tRNA(Ile)-lysidine synthetase-like protein